MKTCVVCGNSAFAIALEHHGNVLLSDRRIEPGHLVKERCLSCGSLRAQPGSFARNTEAYYRDEYQHNWQPERYGYVTADGWIPRAQVEWEAVRRLRKPGRSERWLEVGCGAGDVLLRCVGEGPAEALGIELSQRAAELARQRGLQVFESWPATPGQFDVIFALGVLEHTVSPVDFIGLAAARLRPGGSLILALPDLESHTFDAWFIDHLHHFTAPHVRRLLESAGLYGFREGARPAQTPHFMYLAADAEAPEASTALEPANLSCIDEWNRALSLVRKAMSQYPRIGFLGAAEAAAFFLAYALDQSTREPILFDDTCSEPTMRFGREVRPGDVLDHDPPVDAVIVATVPAHYDLIRTRLRSVKVPVIFPLEQGA